MTRPLNKRMQEPLTAKLKEIMGTLAILFNYVATDIQKKSRAFKIGVFSIYLVVSFLVVLQAALYLTPNIFLKLAEDESGQADFTLTAVPTQDDSGLISNSSNSISFFRGINLTQLQQNLSGIQQIAGLAPRWLLPIEVGNPDTPAETFKVIAILLDSERERALGFGTNIDLKDLGKEQCWISKSTSSLAGLTGDRIHIYMNMIESINELQGISASGSASSDPNATIRAIARSLIDTSLTAQGARRESADSDLYLIGNDPNAPIIRVGQTLPDLSGIVLTPGVTPNYQLEVNSSGLVEALIPVLYQGLTLDTNFTVTETVESPHGKWPKALGNVIVIDSKYMVKQIEDNLIAAVQDFNISTATGNPLVDGALQNVTGNQAIQTNLTGNPLIDALLRNITSNQTIQGNLTGNPAVDQFIQNYTAANPSINQQVQSFTNKTAIEAEIRRYAQLVNLDEFALTVNVLLKDRGTIYASQTSVRPNLIKASNMLFAKMGRNYPATISSNLDTALQAFFLFKNFLDNIFNSTVFILILLSALLVYSLMNSNVEEKTYEFGMLRALGLKKVNLTVLLIIQSMFFAVPGLILGLIFSFTLNFMVTYYISNFVTLSNSYTPAGSALALGICIAIFVPLAANVIPIRKALSKTLRDSLNIYHRAVSDVIVRIMKLAEMGISPAQTIGSVTMILMGFLTYYLAPYAFVYQNLPMFFIILNVVMMMMVIGFTLLLNLLQPYFERFLLKSLLLPLPSEKPLESVIIKNFDSHRPRNNKTSLMFSIALAFLIFSGTGFRLNSDIIAQTLRTTYGADLTVTALNNNFLDEQKLRENIDAYIQKHPGVIQAYAFGSQKFLNQPQIPTLRLSSLSGSPNQKIDIISVDRSYLNSIYEDLYVPSSVDPTVTSKQMMKGHQTDVVDSLYTTDGLETKMTFDSRMVLANAAPRKNVDFGTYFGTTEVRLLMPKGLALETSVGTETPALVNMENTIFKARIRGVASKLPGFTFTGYKTFSKYTVVTSHEDYKTMRDKLYSSDEMTSLEKTQTQNYLATIPAGSSYSVAKQSLFVRYQSQVSDADKEKLVNTIQTLVNNQFIIVTDVIGTVTTLQDSLVFIDIFFVLVAFIAIALSFFFIIISFGNNIKENSWEFGVLRAIGLNKKQMTRIYVFEALCLVLSAAILGTIVGIVVAIVSNTLFFLFTELPFTLEFPTLVFCITLVTSLITAVIGSKVAVDDVKNKQIAAIIKALE